MEFGVPGLPASPHRPRRRDAGAPQRHVAHVYAPFEGLPALKAEGARFWKLFAGLDVPPSCVVPTIGAMQGCFAGLALAGQLKGPAAPCCSSARGSRRTACRRGCSACRSRRSTSTTTAATGWSTPSSARVSRGDVGAILWSSPNNPTWIVLKPAELEGIGRLCSRYDVLAIEDLAYFGMDTREDYSVAGAAAVPADGDALHGPRDLASSPARRCSATPASASRSPILSPGLMDAAGARPSPRGSAPRTVGRALIDGIIYPNIACVPESAQYGLLALLKAANDGDRSLFEPARVYASRARAMKRLFLDNGFRLVYDNDLGEPLADGFYFTIAYPGLRRRRGAARGAAALRDQRHHAEGGRQLPHRRAARVHVDDRRGPASRRSAARLRAVPRRPSDRALRPRRYTAVLGCRSRCRSRCRCRSWTGRPGARCSAGCGAVRR